METFNLKDKIILREDVLFQITSHLYSEAIMHHNMDYISKIDTLYKNSLILLRRSINENDKIITSRCIYKSIDTLEKKVRFGSPTNSTDFFEVTDSNGEKRLAMKGNNGKLFGYIKNLHKFLNWNENFRKGSYPEYII